MLLSFALFPKPWSSKYGWGSACLVVAITLDARAHHRRGGPPRTAAAPGAHASSDSEREEEGAPLKS